MLLSNAIDVGEDVQRHRLEIPVTPLDAAPPVFVARDGNNSRWADKKGDFWLLVPDGLCRTRAGVKK